MTETIQTLKEDIAILQEKLRKLEAQQYPEMLLLRQEKVDIVDYNHRTHYRIEYTDSFSGVYKWFVRKLGEIPFLEEVRDVNVYASLEELYQKEVVKQKDDYPYKKYTQEEVKKLQEKDWEIKVETDYRTGKARHKTRIVDKDGNDYKPEPLTAEELLKPKWEPKPQSEEEVADGLNHYHPYPQFERVS